MSVNVTDMNDKVISAIVQAMSSDDVSVLNAVDSSLIFVSMAIMTADDEKIRDCVLKHFESIYNIITKFEYEQSESLKSVLRGLDHGK